MSEDPFPRERFVAVLRRLPAYLRLAWHLGREPALSRARRAAVVAAAGYVASPINLVPGVIPVVGQLDDLAVALAAIRLALDGLSPERRRLHLEAVGLADADLAEDLRAVGATTAWLVRTGVRTTARVASVAGSLLSDGADRALHIGRDLAVRGNAAARHAGSKAGPASDRLREATGRARDAAGGMRDATSRLRDTSEQLRQATRSRLALPGRLPRRGEPPGDDTSERPSDDPADPDG